MASSLAETQGSAQDSRLEAAFTAWKSHNSHTACDAEATIQRLLREVYPDYHVTRTKPGDVDLFAYAAAGFAVMEAHRLEHYDANRRYNAPATRLLGTEGQLTDSVRFGCWRYQWKQDDFLVYHTSHYGDYGRENKLLFVLSPHDGRVELKDGHHPATDRLLLAAGEWTQALHDEIYVFDDMRWVKDKLLFKAVQGSSWDDVILNPDMKRNLMHDVQGFFDNRALYNRMNVPWKRGVILHGVPGNGKTISIKALINALAARADPVPSLYVKSLDACSGPKWSIQQIFTHARKMAPCLLIFEDLDSMVEDKTRSYFLNAVDGLESNEGILMIGSTNHLGQLDAAITKRPSRFDRKYHFRVPGHEERVEYCRYWGRKFDDADGLGFSDELCRVVAHISDGFSFAYLKELFVTSLLALAREEDPGEGDKAGAALESAASGSDNDSASDGVVVEAPVVPAEEGGKPDDSPDKDTDGTPANGAKRTMPEVEVPEGLKDNRLLRVMLREAKTLWEQMDNSENETPSKPKSCSTSSVSRGVPVEVMRAMVEAAN